MTQVLQASDLSLREVKDRFNLQQIWEPDFFLEWHQDLIPLSDAEKQWLDQIKTDFLGLAESALHEEVAKMFMLAPLLSLAGLARSPFLPIAEKQVEITLEDHDEVIRGRIDLMILHQHLWAIVIESKRKSLNVTEALPQALVYMLNSPNRIQPTFGLVLNGTEFLFLKLDSHDQPQYGTSQLFSLINPGNDLYEVLKVLRRLRDLVLTF